MLLTINISNKETRLAGYENDNLKFSSAVSTALSKTPPESAVAIKNIFELYGIDIKKIDSCIIASVAPLYTKVVQEGVHILTGIEPMLVGPGIKTGVNIMTDNPSEVGTEIVSAAAVSIMRYRAPQIIVLFGTAITFAVINEKKQLIGTVITPGVSLALQSLTNETALLPQTCLKKPERVIGKNSSESMESGIYYSTKALIAGISKEIEKELASPAEIIFTGDTGKIFAANSKKIKFDKNLVLDGLNLIYNKNTDKK